MCIDILISELIPNEPAWVKEKYDEIYASTSADGIRDPIEVWECDGEKLVVHGHHRVMVSKDLGRESVPCKSGCPADEGMAKWTIKKRIAQGYKGFEAFPQAANVEGRSDLNKKENEDFYRDIFWREA